MNKKVSKEAQELYELAKLPPPIPRPKRVKMKELDHIADCVVEVLDELIDHNIAWAVDDTGVDGLEHDEFIGAIRGTEPIKLTDFNTGYKYMEFTEAVSQSIKTGQHIKLPLN